MAYIQRRPQQGFREEAACDVCKVWYRAERFYDV